MSKAEEAALKAYPKEDGKVWTSPFGVIEFDRNAAERKGFQEGYELAEKDLGWRSIHDSLPEDGEYVFVRSKEEYKDGTPMLMTVARYDHEIGKWVDYNDECWSADYWMPCPKTPEP